MLSKGEHTDTLSHMIIISVICSSLAGVHPVKVREEVLRQIDGNYYMKVTESGAYCMLFR